MENADIVKENKWLKYKEKGIEGFFFLNGILAVFVLIGIFLLLLREGIPTFREVSIVEFLTSTRWNPTSFSQASYGIVSMVVSTLAVTFGALSSLCLLELQRQLI